MILNDGEVEKSPRDDVHGKFFVDSNDSAHRICLTNCLSGVILVLFFERIKDFMIRNLMLVAFFASFCRVVQAQDVSFETSTLHDENIFDIYDPTPDQIAQFQLDLSKDWDFDNASLGLIYDGSGFLFRDITPRNYQIHLASVNATLHFASEHSEQDSVDDDSTVATLENPDSLDHFLSGTILAGGQFDREEFKEYDNAIIEGSLNFRQPVGINFSFRPIYTVSYHQYMNLTGLTNVQNIFAIQAGTDILPHAWITVAPSYALKTYPTTSTYSYIVTVTTPSGHGKGSGNGKGNTVTRTRTFDLTTPSVRQFTLEAEWKQTFFTGTMLKAGYTYFGLPSSEARIIPQQLRGAIDEGGLIGEFASANEIFDDHFGYDGNQLVLGFIQPLPAGFSAALNEKFIHKKYTVPAMDLSDSLALAPNRIDDQSEFIVNISRIFAFGDKHLKPELEFHYLRNDSNAPFYVFNKKTFLAGLEFSF